MTQQLTEIANGLSAERFGAYRLAVGGDDAAALALYEWNTAISAALWVDLANCEVLVRNALHEQLTTWSDRTYGEPVWYRDPGHLLRPKHLVTIAEARRRATTGARAKPETSGRIVAELNFGFWRYLLASHYERSLWLPALRYKFPNRSRRHVYQRLVRLNDLRNRIAHHEPIHAEPIAQLHNDLLTVLSWITPDYKQWTERQSTVIRQLAARPA